MFPKLVKIQNALGLARAYMIENRPAISFFFKRSKRYLRALDAVISAQSDVADLQLAIVRAERGERQLHLALDNMNIDARHDAAFLLGTLSERYDKSSKSSKLLISAAELLLALDRVDLRAAPADAQGIFSQNWSTVNEG
jgi:hypothetical protein